MLRCQNFWVLLFFVVFLHQSVAQPFNESAIETVELISPQLDLITQDIIHDKVEMDIKKVIRVNPVDLPSLRDDTSASNMDSSLYKIQTLKPYNGQRNYINLKRHSKQPLNEVTVDTNYSGVNLSRAFSLIPSPDKTSKAKHQPKRKHLHFLYNQTDLAGNKVAKSVPVHVTPSAYPVYYMLSKANGRFGKYPLKSFGSPQEFMKYLQKNKIANEPDAKDTKEKV